MYMAVLRQKEGELRALNKLNDSQLDLNNLFLPNIILNDSSTKSLEGISRKYHNKVLLDVRDLDADDISSLEEKLHNDNYSQFKILYPVNILLEETIDEQIINYVRIPKRNINGFFIEWLSNNATKVPNNIVLDFEYIGDGVSNQLISDTYSIIEKIGNKNITVVSGSIPQSVPTKADQNYSLERFEKNLFTKLNKQKFVNLNYGDYCTVSPIPVEIDGPIIPVVQIKYTLNDEYLFVRNGQRRGNYDFVAVCQEIANTVPSFNSNYSWGDHYIQKVINENKNKGNPSVWVSIGVNHHIHTCIDECS